MAQTFSSYAILTISLLDAPQQRLIVVHHQAERCAAIAAARIRLVDGELCAVQHHTAERLIGVVFNRAQEADAHLVHVLRLER